MICADMACSRPDFWDFLGLFGVGGSWACIDRDETSWQGKAIEALAYRDETTMEERIMTTVRNGWTLEFGDDCGPQKAHFKYLYLVLDEFKCLRDPKTLGTATLFYAYFYQELQQCVRVQTA